MRTYAAWCLLLIVALLAGATNPTKADGKERTEEKPQSVAVKVRVDTTETPDLAEWADQAKVLIEKWHSRVAELLPSDGFTPPAEVKLVFKKDMKGVAYTQGTTIVISGDYVRKHPGDFGMVVHELTHVVQAYRRDPRPSWLVEGIADHVRFYHYEPQTKVVVNPRRSSYRDGYRTTAAFLAWVEKNHDKDIVRKLNASLRQGQYRDELFKTHTDKTLDELWQAFVASLEGK